MRYFQGLRLPKSVTLQRTAQVTCIHHMNKEHGDVIPLWTLLFCWKNSLVRNKRGLSKMDRLFWYQAGEQSSVISVNIWGSSCQLQYRGLMKGVHYSQLLQLVSLTVFQCCISHAEHTWYCNLLYFGSYSIWRRSEIMKITLNDTWKITPV